MILLSTLLFGNMNFVIKAEGLFNGDITIFISPDGNDSYNGDEDKPLKTIEKAQAKALLYRNLGYNQITICLRAGVYPPFSIEGTPQSGNEQCRIFYENYPGEEAIISDSIFLDGSDFCTVKDNAVLDKLDEDVRDKIKQYDLSGYSGNWQINKIPYGETVSIGAMLYLDDTVMNLARWPDEEYVNPSQIGTIIDKGKLKISDKSIVERWKKEDNAWIGGYFSSDWAYETIKISNVNDDTVFLEENKLESSSRIYALNLLCELDSENEWYIDKEKKIMYFYPPYDLKNSKIILTSGDRDLISMSGASYISIKGLTLDGTQGIGISTNGSRNIEITNCIIKNSTTRGINLNETYDSEISGNQIFNIGGSGIILGQFITRNDLIDGNVEICDNEIYNFSQFIRTYTPAIGITGVGNLVSRNKIHDAPHNAIMFGFNNNIIEYNEIYRVLSETNDAGAIYAGRSWAQAGNIIRYNKIYDCESSAGTYIMGIYLDDMFSNTTVYANVIDGLPIGIFMGGGHFNIIENNIISNNSGKAGMQSAIFADCRGTDSWFASAFEFEDNKILSNCEFIKELLQVKYLVNPAYEQYPKLRKLLEKNYREPQENIIMGNKSYMHGGFNLANEVIENGKVENNLMYNEIWDFN